MEFFGERPDGIEAPVQESIKTKNFKRRLSIVSALQDPKEEQPQELLALGSEYRDQLHGIVSKMDMDNFIVRPKREQVEKYQQRENWNQLSQTDVIDVEQGVAPLPYDDDDEENARRFDLLVLNLELAILESDPKLTRYQERIRELGSGLDEKKAIPLVSAQMELILEVQTDEFWEYVTLPTLENVRKKLRDLIKFVDSSRSRDLVYTNFEDEIGEEYETADLVQKDVNLKNYRLKVEKFIREHETHITIHKLKHNQPISENDVDALEEILFSGESPGNKADYEATYGTEKPLGKLVRKIPSAWIATRPRKPSASSCRAPFTPPTKFTFINRVIDHLAQNGMMQPGELFQLPFTDFHDQGVIGGIESGIRKGRGRRNRGPRQFRRWKR
ncbi:MAG: hypothetical protein N2C14_22035, partial [Planctomycetales bacterium]